MAHILVVRPFGRRAHHGERVAFRRSTAAILGPITVSSFTGPEACTSRYPGSIGAALHPMLSKPLKAAPSSGADGDRASWAVVTSHGCRRHTLLRPLSVPRRRPQLSKACRQYRALRTAQQ